MNSRQLCQKLKIDEKQLAAAVVRGLPRAKIRGKWVYDERAVLEWIAGQALAKNPGESTGTASGTQATSHEPPVTEIIARTVSEACRLLTQMGHPISPRGFSQWITEEGFPGRPGRPGKPDAEFPLYAILAWRGAKQNPHGEAQSELAPRSRLATARAALAELELEKERGNLVPREEALLAMQRLVATGLSTLDGLADFAASLAEGKLADKIRDRMTEYLAKLRESWADQLAQEKLQEEKS